MKFIYTKDDKMVKKLKGYGYPFLCKAGNYYIFENTDELKVSIRFAEEEKGSFFFSDKLTFSGVF